ncbi:MAG: mannosyltransferase family protein, partial [Thermomicrobiales bacterium]
MTGHQSFFATLPRERVAKPTLPGLDRVRSSRPKTERFPSTPPVMAGVIHLLLVHIVAAITVWRSPGRDALRPALDGPAKYLVSPLTLWDGAWYEQIARSGYGSQREAAAFWPVFPWLIRVVARLTGMGIPTTGVLISHFAFLGALLMLYRMIAIEHGASIATRTVWLLVLSPVAFFFSALYSESLFLLLSVSAIALAREGRWRGAALALFTVTLTRSAGMLVALPVGLALVAQFGWSPRRWWRQGFLLAVAVSGPLLFMIRLDRLWNDPLLMLHAQSHGNRVFSWPWQTLWKGFRLVELRYVMGRQTCFDALRDGAWAPCRDALDLKVSGLSDDLALASVLLALALLPIVIRKLNPGDAIYAVALLVFPMFSMAPDSPLLSFPRFLLVSYP